MARKLLQFSVETCLDCPFREHSGLLTPDAQHVCTMQTEQGAYKKICSVLETPYVPSWCPLMIGEC